MRPETPRHLATAGVLLWAGLVLLLFATDDPSVRAARVGAGSTTSSLPRGTQRLHDALRAAGAPVTRLRAGGSPPADRTLLLVDPPRGARVDQSPILARLVAGELDLVVAATRRGILEALPWLPDADVPGTIDRVATSGRPVVDLPLGITGVGADGSVSAFARTPPEWTPLVATPAGEPVAIARPWGRGRLVLVGDPRLFENAWVDQQENARLALALCGGRSGLVLDDRFAEAAPGPAGTLDASTLLYGTPTGRAAAAGILGLALALFLGGIRPGGIRGRAGAPSPGALAAALGNLLLLAGRGGAVIEHFQRDLRRRAALRFGVDAADPEAVATALAHHTGRPRKDLFRLLTERPAPRGLAERVRALDDLRRMTGTP